MSIEQLFSLLTRGVLLVALAIPVAAQAETGFVPWSENVFSYIQQEYGSSAERRMRRLHDIIEDNYDAPVEQKLVAANNSMNNLPWISDRQKYHRDDYWATPLQTIATFGGDCEDIAITKFVVLRAMGVPGDRLSLGFAKIKSNGEHHMVLLYSLNPELPPEDQRHLILDNYVKEIKGGWERTDLKAIYSISGGSHAVVYEDDGRHRTVKADIPQARHEKLHAIVAKVEKNRAFHATLNDGRPLY